VPTQFGFAHGWREELIPESQREGNVHHATRGMIVGFPVMMALNVALG
jgi:zinc transporter ZupT